MSWDSPQPTKEDDGGWGSSNATSGGGGWVTESATKNTSSSGGWGAESATKNTSSSGGWGAESATKNTSSSGGWGAESSEPQRDQPRKSSWGGDNSPRKRFRKEGEEGNKQDGERPAPYKPEDLNIEEEVQLQSLGAGENFHRYKDQKVTCLPVGKITPIEKFEDIVSSKLLLKNIKDQKYTELTPIQKWATPAIMASYDLIGCAQTGSGKTAAFLLPILQSLLNDYKSIEPNDPNSDCQNPYCLIISPTRELANQIYRHATMLSNETVIKCVVIYGQIATCHLKAKLSKGCEILVATPGRLKDFVNRGWIGFKNIKYVVLDEGDRLVDEGFTADIRSFFGHETMPSKEKRQTLFFSATFKESTQINAREYLKDEFIFLTVGRVGAANEDIKQEFLSVSRQDKKRELKKILDELPGTEKAIIFTQTKSGADMLAGYFTCLNLSSTSIHGDRHQSQREQAIRAFRKGEKRFLISSPVGNRGLDLPLVSLVINYDLPTEIDEYVHRIGRTGRAGHTGRAISFFDIDRDNELLPKLIEILTEAKQDIPEFMTNSSGPTFADESANAEEWGSSTALQAGDGETEKVDAANSDEVW